MNIKQRMNDLMYVNEYKDAYSRRFVKIIKITFISLIVALIILLTYSIVTKKQVNKLEEEKAHLNYNNWNVLSVLVNDLDSFLTEKKDIGLHADRFIGFMEWKVPELKPSMFSTEFFYYRSLYKSLLSYDESDPYYEQALDLFTSVNKDIKHICNQIVCKEHNDDMKYKKALIDPKSKVCAKVQEDMITCYKFHDQLMREFYEKSNWD